MNERKSLVQAMYELCVRYKEVQDAAQLGEDIEAELDGMDDAINELCRTVGLSRKYLEQDCY